MKISPWLIVAAIAALALGIAGVLMIGKPLQTQERRAAQPAQKQQQSSAPKRSGSEACRQQCSALRKGYVYRAERRLDGGGGQVIEPEVCRCV
jgi:hypothetical protein